ncbi:hypothetical protein BN1723_014817 [Verticillium longisporum]|uniref:Uncharacterized protein n=3 Tax=Verticillium longisporum TaxID=100787 RepID=A0A0G4MII1_VERLO|nr:hypothetical protein BN1723_014817 [Verticillium longisporum]
MQSPDLQSPDRDVSPSESIQTLPTAASALRLPKRQNAFDGHPLAQNETGLPYRRSNPSAASLFASTQTPPGSRSESPVGRGGSPARNLSGPVFSGSGARSLIDSAADSPGDPLNLLLQSYVPHIAIYTSQETTNFANEKGFKNGLWELLRPFGERVQGKITIRDSNGSSRAWEDYSIRFVPFGDNIEAPDATAPTTANGLSESAAREKKKLYDVEAVVERHLRYAEDSLLSLPHHGHLTRQGLDIEATSPYYSLYLRRLLSGIPISPHETFSHPIACVIAISSRSKSPIEELRTLYNETRDGSKQLPGWVDGDYLRYYVLVHDEENDDITRSMALFDQMKRHLGLHCHLLRLRSSQSAETDDDSIPLPRSDWMTAEEELADIKRSDEQEDFEDPTRHIFESDATAIRTFVREMVTQSIIPTMERHVSVWNDQVASRRRGIAGRFMNLSRKWGGFGGSSRTSVGGSGSTSSFESQGYYRPDAPEAIMRKLADYAFMLRDWKLAHSTYDLLRSDFSDAKAWKYHAATNEMAALTRPLALSDPSPVKREKETIYKKDSDDEDGNRYFGPSDEEDSDDESKDGEDEAKKDEDKASSQDPSAQSQDANGAKDKDANSKGTLTPSGKQKEADAARKGKSLKRPGSPNLSESSETESTLRKKKLKKNGSSVQVSRSGTPLPSGHKHKVGMSSMSDGEATGGEMSDGQQRKKKIKLLGTGARGTPTGSRAGSPAPAGAAGSASPMSPNPRAGSPSRSGPIEPWEVFAALPPQGISSKELNRRFNERIGDGPGQTSKAGWINIVKDVAVFGRDKLLRPKEGGLGGGRGENRVCCRGVCVGVGWLAGGRAGDGFPVGLFGAAKLGGGAVYCCWTVNIVVG